MRMAPTDMYLNTGSPVDGTVGEGLGGVPLVEKVYHLVSSGNRGSRGIRLRGLKILLLSSVLFLS